MAYDKVIDSAQLDADLTSVADAIRAKGGTSESMEFPDGFVSAVEGISAGGGGGDADPYAEVYEAIAKRTATSVSLGAEITQVPIGMCYGMSSLKSFDFTYVNRAMEYAFYGTGLESVYMPLSSGSRSIQDSCFANCKSLVSFSSPTITGLYGTSKSHFEGCTSLELFDMPSAEVIGARSFRDCTALESISLPLLETMGQASFDGCTALKNVNFPVLTAVSTSGFTDCSSLEMIDLPAVTSINSHGFRNCTSLETIILRSSALATLVNIAAFGGTPFASGGTGGTVYVPSALISEYQAATNWANLYAAGTCNFVAIEGSEYE